MSRLPYRAIGELKEALGSSYVTLAKLEEFLKTKLDRRFNDLASREIPLADSIFIIADKANEQGWIADLVRAAAADRPHNQTLARLCKELAALPAADPSVVPSLARSVTDRPSLLCGRAPQWNEVCQCAPSRVHQVLLVPGGRGQEPMHFRERVQVWLPPDPTRTMVTVCWRTPPRSLAEMVDAFADAMGTTPAELPRMIREMLAHKNLVVLHPCLTDDFDQDHVIEYYTKWLPSALEDRAVRCVKCLQPIEWPIREQGGGLLRFLRRDQPAEREAALRLVARLKSEQAPQVRIIDVDELLNLERGELETFLEGSELPADHQRLLLAQLLGGPQVPGYMFKTIDDYWKSIGALQ